MCWNHGNFTSQEALLLRLLSLCPPPLRRLLIPPKPRLYHVLWLQAVMCKPSGQKPLKNSSLLGYLSSPSGQQRDPSLLRFCSCLWCPTLAYPDDLLVRAIRHLAIDPDSSGRSQKTSAKNRQNIRSHYPKLDSFEGRLRQLTTDRVRDSHDWIDLVFYSFKRHHEHIQSASPPPPLILPFVRLLPSPSVPRVHRRQPCWTYFEVSKASLKLVQ